MFLFIVLSTVAAYAAGDATYLMYENRWDKGVVIVFVIAGSINTYGTGFWVSENILVTARHVVFPNGLQPDRISIIKGSWSSTAEILYEDELTDVAVLRVNSMPDEYFIFQLDLSVEKGDEIIVVGYPWQVVYLVDYNLEVASLYPRANWGKITWIHPINNYVIEFSAGTDQGNSGGPVIDVQSGGVVGLVSFALDEAGVEYSTFYLTSSSEIKSALEDLGVSYSIANPIPIPHTYFWPLVGVGALLMLILVFIFVVRKK